MVSINLYASGVLNCNLQFPSSWDDLLPEEVIEFARLQLLFANDQPTAKATMVYFIIEKRADLQKIKLPDNWKEALDPDQLATDGFDLLDFLYTSNQLHNQPLPVIELPLCTPSKMVGPKSGFSNITCGEFEDAEYYFYEFVESPSNVPLAMMASVLWRPAGIIYCKDDAEKNYDHFVNLLPEILYSIYLWYSGCRSLLPKMFPTVYENDGKKNDFDMMAFTKCIHAAAGPKNGTRDNIRKMPLLELMFDMEQEAIHAKEIQEQYEQHQRTTVH